MKVIGQHKVCNFSAVPLLICPSFLLFKGPKYPLSNCSVIPLLNCSSFPLSNCSTVPLFNCPGVPVYPTVELFNSPNHVVFCQLFTALWTYTKVRWDGHWDLTLRKIATWLSKNCQKTWHFFQKNCQKLSFFFNKIAKDKFWQFFLKKMSSFGPFFDIQMAIFRRVRSSAIFG